MHTFIEHLAKELQLKITNYAQIAGGDINKAIRLQSGTSCTIFIKYNNYPNGQEMLEAEAHGLELIRASNSIQTPTILGQGTHEGTSYLALEFISSCSPNKQFWTIFGQQLASMHKSTSSEFGWLKDNFIGSLPQSNYLTGSWYEFYCLQRIMPQLERARDLNYLSTQDHFRSDAFLKEVENIFPKENPSLIHGDLWSGNFICNVDGHPVLIDPSVTFGHREMDMAMSKLFGGFSSHFYDAYNRAWPMAAGFDERMDVYQLYYLLVHLNLFGAGYLEQVRRILYKYS